MINVILFGFTGLGNAVLRGLLKNKNVKVTGVFSRHYEKPYPYYDEIQIEKLCEENGIACYLDLKINDQRTVNLIKGNSPDLIIVSSFNQIIKKEVLTIPQKGIINFHPSLLPKYRGPYPDQAVILNDEKETGVTVHYITDKVDSGNILTQKKIEFMESDNYSSLKKKLADLSEAMVDETISLFLTKEMPEGERQNEDEATLFAKPSVEDGYLENEIDIDTIKNKVRALNPFPGTSILVDDKRINVNSFQYCQSTMHDGIHESKDCIDVIINSLGIRLFKKK